MPGPSFGELGAAWLVSSDVPRNQTFVKAFRAKYGSDPDQFAAQAGVGTPPLCISCFAMTLSMHSAQAATPGPV